MLWQSPCHKLQVRINIYKLYIWRKALHSDYIKESQHSAIKKQTNISFKNETIWMTVIIYIKRCSASSAIRETQIKIMMKYVITLFRMALKKKKQTDNAKSVLVKNSGNWNSHVFLVGMQYGTTILETMWQLLIKLNKWPSNPQSWVFSLEKWRLMFTQKPMQDCLYQFYS